MEQPDPVDRSSVPLKDYLDTKFGEVNGGITALRRSIDELNRRHDQLVRDQDALETRVTRLEGRVDTNETRLAEQRGNVRWALGLAIPAVAALIVWLATQVLDHVILPP